MITATIASPRAVPLLYLIAGTLLTAYVALIVATILFASLQTQLAQNVQDMRMEIAKLEGKYYASVTRLDASDPHALGYITPQHVQYVSAAKLPNLTFAGN